MLKYPDLLNMCRYTLTLIMLCAALGADGQEIDGKSCWLGILKGGIRIQKVQKLYWENGLTFDFASPKLAGNRIHIGASYASSRLGSAYKSNAIKQDNYLASAAYYFRHEKQLQPFTRINAGYFYADYEYAIFDVLPHNTYLLSVDAGMSYQFVLPFTVNASIGYNTHTGNGISGPGTLFPVYYQMSLYYTILKKK